MMSDDYVSGCTTHTRAVPPTHPCHPHTRATSTKYHTGTIDPCLPLYLEICICNAGFLHETCHPSTSRSLPFYHRTSTAAITHILHTIHVKLFSDSDIHQKIGGHRPLRVSGKARRNPQDITPCRIRTQCTMSFFCYRKGGSES